VKIKTNNVLKKFFKKTKKNLQAGFSLLEMVMVLGIFSILTAVVTYNYGAFNNQMTLTNLAYEIAMQVREAQVYSLGVRSSNNTFDNRYGVYFKKGANSFIYFIDREPVVGEADGKCDDDISGCDACVNPPGPALPTECQQKFSLSRNMIVQDVLVNETSTSNPVFITFNRPDTEAIIMNGSSPVLSGKVEVIIKSPDNQFKKIVIKQNGYISVENHEQN